MSSERLGFEQPSLHFGTFARKIDPRVTPKSTQASGQRNPRVNMGACSEMIFGRNLHHIAPFQFWWRGSDRVFGARLFHGVNTPTTCPNMVHFREPKTLENHKKKVHPREPTSLGLGCLCLQMRNRLCLQTRYLPCLQTRHLLCLQTHLLCQQTGHLRSPKRSPFH